MIGMQEVNLVIYLDYILVASFIHSHSLSSFLFFSPERYLNHFSRGFVASYGSVISLDVALYSAVGRYPL